MHAPQVIGKFAPLLGPYHLFEFVRIDGISDDDANDFQRLASFAADSLLLKSERICGKEPSGPATVVSADVK